MNTVKLHFRDAARRLATSLAAGAAVLACAIAAPALADPRDHHGDGGPRAAADRNGGVAARRLAGRAADRPLTGAVADRKPDRASARPAFRPGAAPCTARTGTVASTTATGLAGAGTMARRSGRSSRAPGFRPGFTPWRRGSFLPPAYQNYIVDEYWRFHLRRPPYGYHWVEVGDEFLLVSVSTGLIFDVVTGD